MIPLIAFIVRLQPIVRGVTVNVPCVRSMSRLKMRTTHRVRPEIDICFGAIGVEKTYVENVLVMQMADIANIM